MRKLIEQYIEELVLEIKEDNNPIYEIFRKNTDVVSCNFVARTTGVVSGTKIAQIVYKKINPKIQFKILKEDGSFVNRGDVICVMSGSMNDLYKGETLALNFLRYMSGIASSVAKYRLELNGLDTDLLFSGHCAPGLDEFAQLAFVDGGGLLREENKNYCVLNSNTIARFESVDDAIHKLKVIDRNFKFVVEVNDQLEFEDALMSNAAVIRVNSSKEQFINNCTIINNGKKILELCSEIDLKKVRSTAKLGYRYIIIPSLSDASKALPIDMCVYKRFKKIK